MKFDQIYKAYWQRVFRLCMGYVNDKDLAQDLAQETFVIVLRKLPEFRNEAKVSTWIFRIASNICLRQIEKTKRHPKGALPSALTEPAEVDVEGKIQFLYKCISELPEMDRIVISLELENVKQEDIASIVGLSNSNVRVRIHRIKQKLRIKFEDYEG
ncbi:MAG: sigma-70 family RNA polymerase sigma factor [Bacteroidota bacterium]